MNKTFSIYKPTFMEKGKCVGFPTRWWFPEFRDKKEQTRNTQKAKELSHMQKKHVHPAYGVQ